MAKNGGAAAKILKVLRFFEDFDRANDFKRSKIDLALNLGNF